LKTSPADIPKEAGRLNICSTPTNYLLTNKLSELIHRSSSEPKLAEIIDGVFLINLVDFWHTVEFSRIRRTPQRPVFRPKPLWGNSSNLHGAFAPVKLGSRLVPDTRSQWILHPVVAGNDRNIRWSNDVGQIA
jgi:hypothetical protein